MNHQEIVAAEDAEAVPQVRKHVYHCLLLTSDKGRTMNRTHKDIL